MSASVMAMADVLIHHDCRHTPVVGMMTFGVVRAGRWDALPVQRITTDVANRADVEVRRMWIARAADGKRTRRFWCPQCKVYVAKRMATLCRLAEDAKQAGQTAITIA
jgi:hypothetical protein